MLPFYIPPEDCRWSRFWKRFSRAFDSAVNRLVLLRGSSSVPCGTWILRFPSTRQRWRFNSATGVLSALTWPVMNRAILPQITTMPFSFCARKISTSPYTLGKHSVCHPFGRLFNIAEPIASVMRLAWWRMTRFPATTGERWVSTSLITGFLSKCASLPICIPEPSRT